MCKYNGILKHGPGTGLAEGQGVGLGDVPVSSVKVSHKVTDGRTTRDRNGSFGEVAETKMAFCVRVVEEGYSSQRTRPEAGGFSSCDLAESLVVASILNYMSRITNERCKHNAIRGCRRGRRVS